MKAIYPTSTVLLLGDSVILLLMIPNLCGRAARPYGYYQTCCHPSMMIVCVTHADLWAIQPVRNRAAQYIPLANTQNSSAWQWQKLETSCKSQSKRTWPVPNSCHFQEPHDCVLARLPTSHSQTCNMTERVWWLPRKKHCY